MLGHVINDRYKLIKTLGEGGFGVVYRARDLALSRDVAIKLLSLNAQKDPAQAERFMAEARITSKLHHPNLVTLYDSGQVQSVSTPNEHALVGQLFLVTELLLGASLERVLEHKVLDLPQTMSLLRQLAEGLAVAHAHGVIHRDIKPPNIFVHQVEGPGGNREGDGEGQGEVVKLLDFGIAKVADEQTHTLTGQLFGTPYYMSPEQIYGKKQLTHATDIYSLGVLTFHCLTGQVPFDGDSQYVIFNKHIHEAVPRLSLHHPELKRAEIQAVVEGLMEKRPQDRPQGALEVLELLDNLEALCPAWFEPPAPLLEGVPLNRGDTERVRLSELNTGALDMSALVFELTPPEGAGAGGGAGGAQEDDAGDAELELLGALAPSEPTRRSPPPRPPAPPPGLAAPPRPSLPLGGGQPLQPIPPPLFTSLLAPPRADALEIEESATLPFFHDARLPLPSPSASAQRAEHSSTVVLPPLALGRRDDTLPTALRSEHTARTRMQSASVWGYALIASAALIVVGALWSAPGASREPLSAGPPAAPPAPLLALSPEASAASSAAASAAASDAAAAAAATAAAASASDAASAAAPAAASAPAPAAASPEELRPAGALDALLHVPLPGALSERDEGRALEERALEGRALEGRALEGRGRESTAPQGRAAPLGAAPGALSAAPSPRHPSAGVRVEALPPSPPARAALPPSAPRAPRAPRAAPRPRAPLAASKPLSDATPALPPAPALYPSAPRYVKLYLDPTVSIYPGEAISVRVEVFDSAGRQLQAQWEIEYRHQSAPPVKSRQSTFTLKQLGEWFFKACVQNVCSRELRSFVRSKHVP